MKITTSPVKTDGMTQAEALQHTINHVRQNCSYPIQEITPSNRVWFPIENIQCDTYEKDSAEENMSVYFFGTGGECVKTNIFIRKGNRKLLIKFGESLAKLCRKAGKESIDICSVGFSTLRGDVTFTWS